MEVDENTGKTVTVDQEQGGSPKTFTQEQVNEMMKKRLERSHNSFFERYGVKDLNELDELFAKAKDSEDLGAKVAQLTQEKEELNTKFNELTAQNDQLSTQYKDLTKNYAFQANKIDPNKINDIEMYFKGKGLDINAETLGEELKNHQHWKINEPPTVVNVGNEQSGRVTDDGKEMASKFFGVDF